MKNYSELIRLLACSHDKSNDDLVFLSEDLLSHTEFLESLSVRYEIQSEGVRIDLSEQEFKIFKKKSDAVSRACLSDFDFDMVVIEGGLVFHKNESVTIKFFENIIFWHRFKKLMLEENIFQHDDVINKHLIFLSETHGRVDVGYEKRSSYGFYEDNHDLKISYQSLVSKISLNSEFKSFFRDSFLNVAKSIYDLNGRYTESLKNVSHIIESASRDFELYKNKFSFKDFREEVEKDREKYFKDYQASLSDFLSKISSFPLQFGAYIFLIARFKEELVPLLVTAVVVIAWSWFSVIAVCHISNNLRHIKEKFHFHLKEIILRSGVGEFEVESYKREVDDQFDKTLALLFGYRVLIIVFSLCAMAFCIHFIGLLVCPFYG